MRTCGVQLSFLCLNKACWWFVVVWELTWMRAKHLQRKVHWNSWIPKSHELLYNVISQVNRTSIYQRHKDKNSTAACSMPEKPPGPPFSLWSHGCSSAMPADDKIFGIRVPTEPYGNRWSLEGNINSNRKKSCPLEEESRRGGSSLTQLYVVLGWWSSSLSNWVWLMVAEAAKAVGIFLEIQTCVRFPQTWGSSSLL